MEEEKIRELQDILDGTKEAKSIGLKNVNERIKLFFGNEFGITVSSEPGQGTEIVIKLPVNKEE